MDIVEKMNGIDFTMSEGNGIKGLRNLGNTCYMNSALQCLSNIPPLRQFFMENRFKTEMNKENFMGTGGLFVSRFAHVLYNLWNIKATKQNPFYTPTNFKK